MKRRADPHGAFGPNPAVHQRDQLFGNRQAQSGSTKLATGRSIGLVKRAKDFVDQVIGNPNSRVGNGKVQHDRIGGLGFHVHFQHHFTFCGETSPRCRLG